MSQTEELLNGLSEEEMAAYTVIKNEPHIVINGDRTISVPTELKRIAVQYDKDIETVTFDCPRYWDDIDMSEHAIYINYKRADGELGSYIAENIVIDGNDDSVIHFTWTVSSHVSLVKGQLLFLVCIKDTSEDGNIVTHWNSELCKDMYVSEGLECADVIVDEYPDVITQLIEMVNSCNSGSDIDLSGYIQKKEGFGLAQLTLDGMGTVIPGISPNDKPYKLEVDMREYGVVSVDVPTCTSHLQNDSGFVTEKELEGFKPNGNTVLYTEQTLTDEQKEQARKNIDALGKVKIEKETLPFTYCASYPDKNTFAYVAKSDMARSYWVYECGEIKGGVLSVSWDTTLVSQIEIILYLFDADGNPYKYIQQDLYNGLNNTIPLAGENVQLNWFPPGVSGGFCKANAPFTVQIPDECTVLVCMRATNVVIPDTNTIFTTSNMKEYAPTLFDVTVTKSGGADDLRDALIATGLFEQIPEADKALKNYDATVKSVNHRGLNTIAPENTISAYKLSKEYGFYYVEADISFTSDGVPVLLHDSTIDRTSNGTGTISEMTFDEVRTYDFGSWKSADYTGEQIPSFEEFIVFCKRAGLHPYIEIKSPFTVENAQVLVNIVKRYGMVDKVTWISFGNAYLGYIKDLLPNARLGQVTGTIAEGTITNANNLKTDTNEVFIDAQFNVLTDDMVNLCIDADIPLEVWNVFTTGNVTSANGYISGMTTDALIAGKILQESVK